MCLIGRCSFRRKLVLLCGVTVTGVGLFLYVARSTTFDGFTKTKDEFVPDARSGSAFSLYMYEQSGNAATNLMNLQCWAGLFGMNVVEPSIRRSSEHGDGVFYFNQDLSNERFRDLFDFEHWNRHSRKKKYLPLISLTEFLGRSSRNVIYVEVMYGGSLKCPHGKLEFPFKYPHTFLSSHGFKIVRKACIDLLQQGRLRSQQEFNDLVFGNVFGQGNFTVVFDEWRAIRNESEREGNLDYVDPTSKWNRILVKDSPCTYKCLDLNPYYPMWNKVPSQNLLMDKSSETESTILRKSKLGIIPSDQVLEDTVAFRTKHMKNRPYIAIAMRLELYRKITANENSYRSCLEAAKKLWKHATNKYGLNQTFITSDIGKYGSHSWGGQQSTQRFYEDIIKMVGMSTPSVQSSVYDLETVIGSTGRVRMAWTQGILAAQARCVIFLGGGAFQVLLFNIHSALYVGRECFVQLDTFCKQHIMLGLE